MTTNCLPSDQAITRVRRALHAYATTHSNIVEYEERKAQERQGARTDIKTSVPIGAEGGRVSIDRNPRGNDKLVVSYSAVARAVFYAPANPFCAFTQGIDWVLSVNIERIVLTQVFLLGPPSRQPIPRLVQGKLSLTESVQGVVNVKDISHTFSHPDTGVSEHVEFVHKSLNKLAARDAKCDCGRLRQPVLLKKLLELTSFFNECVVERAEFGLHRRSRRLLKDSTRTFSLFVRPISIVRGRKGGQESEHSHKKVPIPPSWLFHRGIDLKWPNLRGEDDQGVHDIKISARRFVRLRWQVRCARSRDADSDRGRSDAADCLHQSSLSFALQGTPTYPMASHPHLPRQCGKVAPLRDPRQAQ